MNQMEALLKISKEKVIVILRSLPATNLLHTLEALYQGGVRCVEVTMNTSGALEMIRVAKEVYGAKMLIGAGTVLDSSTARLAILAGADFVLSPHLSLEVISTCHLYGKLAVPGVLTPTEAVAAQQAGALLIKVFPIDTLGPGYLKSLLAPLGQLRLLPVGGVDEHNAAAYLDHGAFAVGIGSCLVTKQIIESEDFNLLKEKTKELVRSIKK